MPNGKESETLSATAPAATAREIERLAFESGLSRSRYILALLEGAVVGNRRFRYVRGEFREEPPAEPVREVSKATKTKQK